MSDEQRIRDAQFKKATGSARNFRAIDGVGDKTAKKLRAVRGINAPADAADYSADELAEEAGISKTRARKVIQGGGGNPRIDDRGRSGSIAAGNIADAMDSQRREAAEVVQQRRGVFEDVVQVAEEVPDRRERRRGNFGPLEGRDPEEIREIGRAATTLREATADPIDPTEDRPDLGFDESDRERAGEVTAAARNFLEAEQGVDFQDAQSQLESDASDLGTVEQATDTLFGASGLRDTTVLRASAPGTFLRQPPEPADDAPGYRNGSTGRFVGYEIDEHDEAKRNADNGRIKTLGPAEPVPRDEAINRWGRPDGIDGDPTPTPDRPTGTDALEARMGPNVANDRMTPDEDITAQASAFDVSLEPREAQGAFTDGITEASPSTFADEPDDLFASDLERERRMDAAESAGVLDPGGGRGEIATDGGLFDGGGAPEFDIDGPDPFPDGGGR